MEGIAGELS